MSVIAWGRTFDEDGSGGGVHLQRITNAYELRHVLGAVNAPGRGVVRFDDERGLPGRRVATGVDPAEKA